MPKIIGKISVFLAHMRKRNQDKPALIENMLIQQNMKIKTSQIILQEQAAKDAAMEWAIDQIFVLLGDAPRYQRTANPVADLQFGVRSLVTELKLTKNQLALLKCNVWHLVNTLENKASEKKVAQQALMESWMLTEEPKSHSDQKLKSMGNVMCENPVNGKVREMVQSIEKKISERQRDKQQQISNKMQQQHNQHNFIPGGYVNPQDDQLLIEEECCEILPKDK